MLEAWKTSIPALLAELKKGNASGDEVRDGWICPSKGVGDFGADDLLRACTAPGGLAALGEEEAICFQAFEDPYGQPLTGASAYRWRVPASGIPPDACWSLTMDTAEPDGRFFLADNPIRRSAIGDRTRGLARNADGSLDILIRREAPKGPLSANWLPSPPGPLRLAWRAYLPRKEQRGSEMEGAGAGAGVGKDGEATDGTWNWATDAALGHTAKEGQAGRAFGGVGFGDVVECCANIEAEGVECVHRGFEIAQSDAPDRQALDPFIRIFSQQSAIATRQFLVGGHSHPPRATLTRPRKSRAMSLIFSLTRASVGVHPGESGQERLDLTAIHALAAGSFGSVRPPAAYQKVEVGYHAGYGGTGVHT